MNTSDFRLKYRPKRFAEIIGNKLAIRVLKNIILTGRIPCALLFHGPPGTGKSSLTYVLAKALNCLHFDDDVCDECENCLAMDKYFPKGAWWLVNTHDCTRINVTYLDDLIRRYFNVFPQTRIGKNIHVFDEFQRAQPQFQEKFLTELETNPDLLLIFSLIDISRVEEAFQQRVTVLKTTRPEPDELISWLHRICSCEKIVVKQTEALRHLAISANLLPRECLRLLQTISYVSNSLTLDLVQEVSEDDQSILDELPEPVVSDE